MKSTYLPSKVLKDFSVENLETTPSTFLSKFSCEIYLHRVFTLYLTWGTFSLVCNLSVFFYFLLLFCFFYRYFSRQILTIHWIAGKGEGIIIFLVFNFHPLTNFQLVHWDFYHFFLLKLIVIPRMIAYETCFPGRFAFFLHFYLCNYVGVIDFDISKWHYEDLSSYQTITLLLQNELLN